MGRDVIDFNHDDDSVTNTGQAIAAINAAMKRGPCGRNPGIAVAPALLRGLDQVADDLGISRLVS